MLVRKTRFSSVAPALLILGTAGAAWAAAETAATQDALLGSLPQVEAATLHSQTLEEVPADVTVITDADIRKYGYRTLNDVLSAVHGFFSSYDRIYHYAGVGGFSLLGDYNTRFLVMLNGHPLTGQVYHSNGLFGQDLGIDMDLAARIEIIRGPSSALHGSNGILANINIAAKSPVDCERLRVSTETGSLGKKKAIVSSSINLGHGANLPVSAAAFNNSGTSLQFPGVSDPVTGVDGEKGYHTFANLIWHDWSFTAYFNNREKQPPGPWGDGYVLFQRGDNVRDSRNYLQASYTRELGEGRLRWQIYYDQYKYDDRFYQPAGPSGDLQDTRSLARGDSVGTQLTWQAPVERIGELTIGGEFDADLRNPQQDYTAYPAVTYGPAISDPDLAGALFVEQQWKISRGPTLYGGLRLDDTRNFGPSLSPRVALVYEQSPKTTYKLVYGRPFRNPSAFERYCNDGDVSFPANPSPRSETAQTWEASLERKLLPNLSFIANVYDYRIGRTIQAQFVPNDVEMCENTASALSKGVEVELNGKAGAWLEANASYSFESEAQKGDSQADSLPRHLAKSRAAAPMIRDRLCLSVAFQFMSGRTDMNDSWLRPVALGDVTLSTHKLHPSFDIVAGVGNVAGWRYSDPIGLALAQMPEDGRSVCVKLIYPSRE